MHAETMGRAWTAPGRVRPGTGSRFRDAPSTIVTTGVPSTAAIMGHPIHPMLVPFPIAFLSAAAVTDLASRRTGDPFWSTASRWLLRAGLASGAAAAVFGAADYFTIGRARRHRAGRMHAMGNAAVMTLALANLLRRDPDGKGGEVDGAAVAMSAATAALLGVTGWLGGELSYKHAIGVSGHPENRGAVRGRRAGRETLGNW